MLSAAWWPHRGSFFASFVTCGVFTRFFFFIVPFVVFIAAWIVTAKAAQGLFLSLCREVQEGSVVGLVGRRLCWIGRGSRLWGFTGRAAWVPLRRLLQGEGRICRAALSTQEFFPLVFWLGISGLLGCPLVGHCLSRGLWSLIWLREVLLQVSRHFRGFCVRFVLIRGWHQHRLDVP